MNGRSLIACVHGSPNNPFNKLQRDNSDLKSGLLAFPGFQFLKTLVLTATLLMNSADGLIGIGCCLKWFSKLSWKLGVIGKEHLTD